MVITKVEDEEEVPEANSEEVDTQRKGRSLKRGTKNRMMRQAEMEREERTPLVRMENQRHVLVVALFFISSKIVRTAMKTKIKVAKRKKVFLYWRRWYQFYTQVAKKNLVCLQKKP